MQRADVLLKMKNGSAVLDWAVYGGFLDTIELVASHPAVDLHARNLAGCSCIMWAASHGSVPVCQWLQASAERCVCTD